jgi:hypothetical protein
LQGRLVRPYGEFFSDLHNRLHGDAVKHPVMGRWRKETLFLDNEEVVPGAFGDESLLPEHHGLKASRLAGLDLGPDIVEII